MTRRPNGGRDRGTAGTAEQLSAIPDLMRAELIERWTAAYGRPPPKGLSRRLLEYAAAYHLQVETFGRLKPALRRKLQQLAEIKEHDAPRTSRRARADTLPPGSRLVREWHGRTYTVEVLDSGFLYDDQHYRSLSEVARAITGARWSGPRFFAP